MTGKMLRGMVITLVLAGGLAACANDPSITDTIDTRSAPDGMKTVGVCYNGNNTTRAAVSEIALKACPKGTTKLKLWDKDHMANACPLTKVNRVVFLCLR